MPLPAQRSARRRVLLAAALSVVAAAALAACEDEVALVDNPARPDASARDARAAASDDDDDDAPSKDAAIGREDASPVLAPVACGEALDGPELKTLEATPGFADELAALDLGAAPDPVDVAKESALTRAMFAWMLESAGKTSASHAELKDAGALGRVILGAAAKDDGGVDNPFLRRGLYWAYLCSRPIPKTLEELKARFGDYETWQTFTVPCAKPKNGPRRIRENNDGTVLIAETLLDAGAGEPPAIRETEVLFAGLRKDGQLDFAAYTASGTLTDRSTFATASSEVVAAAPYTCMTCHVDLDAGTFTRRFPTGTGAGCH